MSLASIKKIIIGSWSFSGDLGIVDQKEIHKTIEFAIENKLHRFDTAPSYNNGKVDKLLSKYKKNILVNTKCGYNFEGVKTFKLSDIEKSLEYSLKLFHKINILFLHSPRVEIKDWDRVISLLDNFKKMKHPNCRVKSKKHCKDNLNQYPPPPRAPDHQRAPL